MKKRLLILLFSVLCFIGLSACMENKHQSGEVSEKYTGEVDKSHGFWEDHSSGEPWIDNSNCRYLEEGFQSFYDLTGVWPYLYVTDNYRTSESFSTYEQEVYDQLFGNCPGNLLFVFIGNDESYYIAAGTGNGDVVNNSTIGVFKSKINRYWTDSSKDGDLARIFGSALEDAGKVLMKGEGSSKSSISWDFFREITIAMVVIFSLVLLGIVIVSVKSFIHKGDRVDNRPVFAENSQTSYSDFFCYRCGTRIITEGRFCPNCGEKLKGSNPNGKTRASNRVKATALIWAALWALIWAAGVLPFIGITSADLRKGTEEFGISGEKVIDIVVDNYEDLTGTDIKSSYTFVDLEEEVDASGMLAVLILFPLGGMLCLYRPNKIKSILCVIFSFLPALFLWVGIWGHGSLADRMEWMKYSSERIGAILLFVLLIVLPIISIVQLVKQIRSDKRKNEMNNYLFRAQDFTQL